MWRIVQHAARTAQLCRSMQQEQPQLCSNNAHTESTAIRSTPTPNPSTTLSSTWFIWSRSYHPPTAAAMSAVWRGTPIKHAWLNRQAFAVYLEMIDHKHSPNISSTLSTTNTTTQCAAEPGTQAVIPTPTAQLLFKKDINWRVISAHTMATHPVNSAAPVREIHENSNKRSESWRRSVGQWKTCINELFTHSTNWHVFSTAGLFTSTETYDEDRQIKAK